MNARRVFLLTLAVGFAGLPFLFGSDSWPLTRYPMFSERVTFPVRVTAAWIGTSPERACRVSRRWLSPDRLTALVERFRQSGPLAEKNLARFYASALGPARAAQAANDGPCFTELPLEGRRLFLIEVEADANRRLTRRVLHAADL